VVNLLPPLKESAKELEELLRQRILVLDGAMGTMIQQRNLIAQDFGGPDVEGCNENLVITRPDVIRDIHAEYYRAGADMVETDTFGAMPLVLAEYGLADRALEINEAAARVAREDSRETEGDRLSYLYTASLRAVPLQTLQHSVVFSGRWSEIEGRSSDSSSVYLYNTAELYRGVNANLGLGIASATAEDGQQTDSSQVNALATLVPHPTTTLNLLHQRLHNTRSGGVLPAEVRLDTRASQASVTYRPLSTLYFFFSYRMEHDDRAGDRFLRNYSLSWSPLPDGSLQVLLRFDESYRSELDSLSRIYSPRIRWNITDRWYAELAYERSLFDSALEMTTRDAYTASMRIWF